MTENKSPSIQDSLKWAKSEPERPVLHTYKDKISGLFLWLVLATGLAFYMSAHANKKKQPTAGAQNPAPNR
jgi:hypothetical protein